MKKILLGTFILAVSAAAVFFGLQNQKAAPHISLNETQDYYTISVSEPEKVATLDSQANKKARDTMHSALQEVVANFKKESGLDSLTEEDIQIQGLGGDRKYALGAEYSEYKGKETVSYVYRIYMDTLGAHPNHFYLTFTFDREGNTLRLADLFTPQAEYLTQLSQEAYAGVVKELTIRTGAEVGSDMTETIRMGTAPSSEALRFYYLTETDLHLLFPPYQVAAYAAGSFDIAIPLSELSGILKPEFN